jgi:3-isopropylmalate dehydratase small subunit
MRYYSEEDLRRLARMTDDEWVAQARDDMAHRLDQEEQQIRLHLLNGEITLEEYEEWMESVDNRRRRWILEGSKTVELTKAKWQKEGF